MELQAKELFKTKIAGPYSFDPVWLQQIQTTIDTFGRESDYHT